MWLRYSRVGRLLDAYQETKLNRGGRPQAAGQKTKRVPPAPEGPWYAQKKELGDSMDENRT